MSIHNLGPYLANRRDEVATLTLGTAECRLTARLVVQSDVTE